MCSGFFQLNWNLGADAVVLARRPPLRGLQVNVKTHACAFVISANQTAQFECECMIGLGSIGVMVSGAGGR